MPCLSIDELPESDRRAIADAAIAKLETLLNLRRMEKAVEYYKSVEDSHVFKYTIFRIIDGVRVEDTHVGTLEDLPPGWSWMKREREA